MFIFLTKKLPDFLKKIFNLMTLLLFTYLAQVSPTLAENFQKFHEFNL